MNNFKKPSLYADAFITARSDATSPVYNFKTQLQKLIDKAADEKSKKAANVILRDMYPSRSRGQMANEFSHFIKEGAQFLMPLVESLIEQRDWFIDCEEGDRLLKIKEQNDYLLKLLTEEK